MTLSDAITRLNYVLRGTDDDAPGAGTSEYNYWLDALNRSKDWLYKDTSKNWAFSFHETAPNEPGTVATTGTTTLTGTDTNFTDYRAGDQITVDGETVRTIDAIASDTSLTVTSAFSNTASSKTFTRTPVIDEDYETYTLHRRFLGASDQVVITKTDGAKVYVDLVKPADRSTTTREAFIHAVNPTKITFSTDITSSEAIVGGTLDVPGYYNAKDLSATTDELPIPIEDWLIVQAAHEIAFNDITYEDKAADLLGKANYLYRQLVKQNRRGTHGRPRSSVINNYRIRNTEIH